MGHAWVAAEHCGLSTHGWVRSIGVRRTFIDGDRGSKTLDSAVPSGLYTPQIFPEINIWGERGVGGKETEIMASHDWGCRNRLLHPRHAKPHEFCMGVNRPSMRVLGRRVGLPSAGRQGNRTAVAANPSRFGLSCFGSPRILNPAPRRAHAGPNSMPGPGLWRYVIPDAVWSGRLGRGAGGSGGGFWRERGAPKGGREPDPVTILLQYACPQKRPGSRRAGNAQGGMRAVAARSQRQA